MKWNNPVIPSLNDISFILLKLSGYLKEIISHGSLFLLKVIRIPNKMYSLILSEF